jgi:peptide/nickel transport system permease protein
MTVFIIRRLMQSVVVIFIMSLITFFGVNVIGNPVDLLIDPECDQACFKAMVVELGLDRPIHEQYLAFLSNLSRGSLGNSFLAKIPAGHLIVQRMPATLELAATAFLITLVVGIPLGMWAGLKPHSVSGKLIMSGSVLGFSLPTFWVGLLFIMIFSIQLDWLPSVGRGETVEVLGLKFSFLTLDGIRHLILPATTMALFHTAVVIRLTRAGVRETVFTDFVKFAHAKGLAVRRVIFVHVLKNILIPIVTVLGMEFGFLIAFAVVVETIFAWPGMGRLLITSIGNLDRPIIVGYLMIVVTLFVLINLVVDIIYSLLDPRVRYQRVR